MSLGEWVELHQNCIIPAGVNFLRRDERSGEMTGHTLKTTDIYTDVSEQTFFVKQSDGDRILPIKGPTGKTIQHDSC